MPRIWKRILKGTAISASIYVAITFLVACGLVRFSHLAQPKPSRSVTDPFARMDLAGLPPVTRYRARDGAQLSYRYYQGADAQIAVLIHGSAGSSIDMHRMALALVQRGATVYVPDLRGHGANYPHGDIAYIGQLDDDMADFLQAVHPQPTGAQWTLVGFSSGGGFALRIAGSEIGKSFDRFVFLSPFLRYNAPMIRPASPGQVAWSSVSIPRIAGITILNYFGIHTWDGLPVLAFPVPADIEATTASYSFRMEENFEARGNYKADIRVIHQPTQVFVGSRDELFLPEKFSAVFNPIHADIPVTIIPGMGHSDMITNPKAIAVVVNTFPKS